ALAVLGRADLALDRVAGAQAEPPDLARAHIDVVGAREVVGLGRAQEAEAVLQDLQHAVAVDRDVVLGELLQDREHHVLLAERRGTLDLQLLGEAQQLRRCLALEFLEVHRGYSGCAGSGEENGGIRRALGVTRLPARDTGRESAVFSNDRAIYWS